MRYELYAYKDVKTGFTQPVVEINEATAIRGFTYTMKSGLMNAFPKDFQLYKLGEFDSESGRIAGKDIPEFIIEGENVVD